MTWKVLKLKDSSLKFIDGDRSSKYPKKSEFKKDGVIFLNAGSISGGRFDISSVNYISQDKYDSILKGRVEPNDIIITTRGNGVGQCFFYNGEYGNALINAQMLIIRADLERIHPKFIYYSFISESCQRNFSNYSSGSAQPQLPISSLKEIEIVIPSLETQKCIANILSTYDDLIENNLKRIKLLEETAQNIYKEWFVNFRFPNYEHTEFDGESGLPVGWEILTVKDYCDIISRGSTLDYNGDEALIPVLNQSCVRNGELELERIRFACPLKENKEYSYLKLNDILINSMGDGTLGRVSKNNTIEDKYIIHNCITFLRAKNNFSQPMLYGYISSKQDYFITVAQGSTGQSTLNLKLINELKINVPTKIIIDDFDRIILPIWQTIGTLKKTNQKLREARDILLPRLMNRTIEV